MDWIWVLIEQRHMPRGCTHIRPNGAAVIGESSDSRTKVNVQVPIKLCDLAAPEVRFWRKDLKFGLCDF